MRHAAARPGRGSGAQIKRTHSDAAPGQQATPAVGLPGDGERDEQVSCGWRARVGQLSYWFVLAGAAAALAVMHQGVDYLKSGTLVLAGFLLVAAIVRLTLPDRATSMLASRRRSLDVAVFTTLGIGLLVAGLVVPAP